MNKDREQTPLHQSYFIVVKTNLSLFFFPQAKLVNFFSVSLKWLTTCMPARHRTWKSNHRTYWWKKLLQTCWWFLNSPATLLRGWTFCWRSLATLGFLQVILDLLQLHSQLFRNPLRTDWCASFPVFLVKHLHQILACRVGNIYPVLREYPVNGGSNFRIILEK